MSLYALSLSQSPRKHSGFTLVELMVVMAIIAILATAGLSAYTGYMKKARDTIRVKDMQTIYRMLLEYNTLYGGIPTVGSYNGYNTYGWDKSSEPVNSPDFLPFLITSGITSKVPFDPINNSISDASDYAYRYYCYSNGYVLSYVSEVTNTRVLFKNYDKEFPCL